MKALLDTHTFLWFVREDTRLSQAAHAFIVDPNADLMLSVASAWEIVIKTSLGRLKLTSGAEAFLSEHLGTNDISPLSIRLEHATAVGRLPPHHRDPFDRMIIAQAISEHIPIITNDPEFKKYTAELIW